MFIVAGGNPWPPPLNDSPDWSRWYLMLWREIIVGSLLIGGVCLLFSVLYNVVWWSQLYTKPRNHRKTRQSPYFLYEGRRWLLGWKTVSSVSHIFLSDEVGEMLRIPLFSPRNITEFEKLENEMWERHQKLGEVRIWEVQYLTTCQFLEISQFYPHNDSY